LMLQLALQDIQQQQSCNDKESMLLDMISLILGFQSDFLLACTSLARVSQPDLHKTIITMQITLRNAVQKLDDLNRMVDQHFTTEGYWKDDDTNQFASKSLYQKTFDSYMNRPSVGNLPIRKISFGPPTEALDHLKTIVLELDTTFCNVLLRGSSLGRIHRMLDRVSHDNINILTRSLLLLHLYFGEKLLGQYSLRQLIVDHMRQCGCILPESLLESEHSRAFSNRLAEPVYDNLKLRLLHRNRHGAYIKVVSLVDWTSLQNEAYLVDAHYRQQLEQNQQQLQHQQNQTTQQVQKNNETPQYYFSKYAVSVLIRLVDRYIESGIEVGLFQSTDSHHFSDLAFAFLYRAFLLSALSQDLSMMRQAKEMALAATQQQQLLKSNNRDNIVPSKYTKGKKKHKNKGAAAATTNSNTVPIISKETAEDLEDIFDLKIIVIKRNFCRNNIEFIAALQQANILNSEPKKGYYQFTSLERIFE
jgi:hypothetical protein